MRPKPLYQLGEYVELVGVYKQDKIKAKMPFKGIVTKRATSEQALTIGASWNVYTIDGVGTYGEAAIAKARS